MLAAASSAGDTLLADAGTIILPCIGSWYQGLPMLADTLWAASAMHRITLRGLAARQGALEGGRMCTANAEAYSMRYARIWPVTHHLQIPRQQNCSPRPDFATSPDFYEVCQGLARRLCPIPHHLNTPDNNPYLHWSTCVHLVHMNKPLVRQPHGSTTPLDASLSDSLDSD
jgi:hypothetical protein